MAAARAVVLPSIFTGNLVTHPAGGPLARQHELHDQRLAIPDNDHRFQSSLPEVAAPLAPQRWQLLEAIQRRAERPSWRNGPRYLRVKFVMNL